MHYITIIKNYCYKTVFKYQMFKQMEENEVYFFFNLKTSNCQLFYVFFLQHGFPAQFESEPSKSIPYLL